MKEKKLKNFSDFQKFRALLDSKILLDELSPPQSFEWMNELRLSKIDVEIIEADSSANRGESQKSAGKFWTKNLFYGFLAFLDLVNAKLYENNISFDDYCGILHNVIEKYQYYVNP
jgi:hypothetical protein